MRQLHLVSITGEVVYNMDVDMRMCNAFRLLDQTAGGEAATGRRRRILQFLYHERYLTRKGISVRLKLVPEGYTSWWDSNFIVFILDMWFVRRGFLAAGYRLAYGWAWERRGFYLRGEGELSPENIRAIQGAVAKVDPAQVEITRRLTPAQRVQQGLSLTDLAHSVVRYRQEKRSG